MIVNHLTTHSRLRKYTLTASMETKTTVPNAMIILIVWKVGIVTPKDSRPAGIWKTAAVSINCEMMETVSHICGSAFFCPRWSRKKSGSYPKKLLSSSGFKGSKGQYAKYKVQDAGFKWRFSLYLGTWTLNSYRNLIGKEWKSFEKDKHWI